MSTQTTEPPPSPEPAPAPRRRLHPLVVGTIAAVASLLVGGAAGGLYAVLVDGDRSPDRREPEVALRFTPDQDESDRGVVGGAAMPDTSFPALDGGLRSFADYGGRPLVVNFWASSCQPCVKEMPDLERVHQEHGDHVAFLGIAVRDQVADSQAMIERTGVTYDMGRDPGGALSAELGVLALPSTVFVNAEGEVAAIETGILSLDELRERVEALVG